MVLGFSSGLFRSSFLLSINRVVFVLLVTSIGIMTWHLMSFHPVGRLGRPRGLNFGAMSACVIAYFVFESWRFFFFDRDSLLINFMIPTMLIAAGAILVLRYFLGIATRMEMTRDARRFVLIAWVIGATAFLDVAPAVFYSPASRNLLGDLSVIYDQSGWAFLGAYLAITVGASTSLILFARHLEKLEEDRCVACGYLLQENDTTCSECGLGSIDDASTTRSNDGTAQT